MFNMVIDPHKAIEVVESLVLSRLNLVREDITSDIGFTGRRTEAIQLIVYITTVYLRVTQAELADFYKSRDGSFYSRHLSTMKDRLKIKGNEYLNRDVSEIVGVLKSNKLDSDF